MASLPLNKAGEPIVLRERLAYGSTGAVGPPKTAASRRTIALDRVTVTVLHAHRRRQEKERVAAGQVWKDTGYVFTTPDGQPLHPDYLTRRFRRLVEASGLPPVRLHDLRHGAASLAHSAGADLKTVQEQLGHTSIVLTADTYTSVLTDKHHKTAEATAGSSWLPLPAAPNPASGPPMVRRRSPLPPRARPGRNRYDRRHPGDGRGEAGVAPT